MTRLLSLAALILLRLGAPAIAETPINISYQPGLYLGLPFFIATEKGYWKEAGLEPHFSTFPAGAQQIAAAPSKSWDVGVTGSPPAVLGGIRFNLVTIAVTDDQSATAMLIARKADAPAILANPAMLKGKQLLLTTNSTAEFAAIACLKKLGLALSDMQLVNLTPALLVTAYSSGNGVLAAAWAPFAFTTQDKSAATGICNGRDAGAVVSGSFVAREDFIRDQPQATAKVLAVYLRAVAFQKAHKTETMAYMRQFYARSGTTLSEPSLEFDYAEHPIFNLDEQLHMFDRAAGPSVADAWHTATADYLKSSGTIAAVPDPKAYISAATLKLIEADPALRAFARGE